MNKKEEKYLLERIWYKSNDEKDTWRQVSRFPHIFLTNAPLTFGHSQLVVPAPKERDSVNESTLFQSASAMIEVVLKVFKKSLGEEKLHSKAPFQKLAEDTYSFGKYIKTLVLRTSASENPSRELKIHFVPYFESNQAECHKRFHSLHTARPDQKGGLIGWLGERETQVDKWLIGGFPGPLSLDEIGRDLWKLPQLAKQLQQHGLANKILKATQ